MADKKNIVILGGGVAGCTAAYWLTHIPEWRAKYRVSLYQCGWRLGGKGASGRNRDTLRSYEHGPHAWYGGYENGFRTMRAVFKEFKEAFGNHGIFSEVMGADGGALFKPANQAQYVHLRDGIPPEVWTWEFPFSDQYGESGDGNPAPGFREALRRLWEHLKSNLRGSALLDQFEVSLEKELELQAFSGVAAERENLFDLAESATLDVVDFPDNKNAYWWMLLVLAQLRKRLNRLIEATPGKHKVLVMADFMVAMAQGAVVDVVKPDRKYEELDAEDFQAWLGKHRAYYKNIDESPYIKGLYEAAFAYKRGTEPNLGAGTALRIAIWIFFGYKGHYIHKMQAGMGEVMFSPLYKVLSEPGEDGNPRVDFHFFHRVTGIELDASKKRVAKVRMRRQVVPRGGYPYLIDASLPGQSAPFWCWPDSPDWDHIENGGQLQHADPPGVDLESRWTTILGTEKDLEVGRDDVVIFAMPAPVLPELVEELAANNGRFAEMVGGIDSVAPAAAQFWINGESGEPDLWSAHGVTEEIIGAGASNPLSIFLDYTPVMHTELPEPGKRHLLYACGITPEHGNEDSLPDPGSDLPQQQHDVLAGDARNLIAAEWVGLFPSLCDASGGFDWSRLGGDSPDFLNHHYHRVNFDGSSRYILSTVDSVNHRLPSASGYANLLLAGDWIKTGIDLGCVEAATVSGMMAAEAVTGEKLGIRRPLED